jgi:hypothetical protein
MIERILSNLFPPRLTNLNPVDDLKDTLEYKYRISRRGFEPNPAMTYGGRVVSIREHESKLSFREHRREIYEYK